MSAVVIDSNFLVAAIDPKDNWHAKAQEIDSSIPASVIRIFSDIVVIESINVLARRSEERKQKKSFLSLASSLQSIIPQDKITWLTPLIPERYLSIFEMIAAYNGNLNFHDCLLTLWMQENNIQHIASFDADFDSVPNLKRIF